MKRMLVLISVLFSGAMVLQAQTEFTWDTHGIGFKTAARMKVTTNNADEFEAQSDNIQLNIFPWQDQNINFDDLADATVDIAKQLKFDNVDAADALEIDDFQGFFVHGKKDGVNALILLLLDKKSSTNLIVTIVYQEGFEDVAVKLAESFYAYD
ncbi:MAG: hypothetical protein JNK41_10285 [Saprospiraceae bacterium]|jgi:hypothetical protein|nr:hypothetical protein [Saprospiraceae bacterium]